MRVVFNHLTVGLIYKDFGRLFPAFIGLVISVLYQLINLYGFLPALIIVFIGLGMLSTLFSYTLHIFSLFLIPLPVCIIITLALLIIAFAAWILINYNLNRKANLQIFKLNYSSRLAFNGLAFLLCNRNIALNLAPRANFWDIHFKPRLAGKIKDYSFETLAKLISDDFTKIQQILGGNTVLYGCTPGTVAKYLEKLPLEDYSYQVIKTLIPPEHAKVFGLTRDFYFHVIIFADIK